MKGHEGVVKILLAQGNVDPNCPDKDGRRPLRWAAIMGHERVVMLFLERENMGPNRPVRTIERHLDELLSIDMMEWSSDY